MCYFLCGEVGGPSPLCFWGSICVVSVDLSLTGNLVCSDIWSKGGVCGVLGGA